MLRHTKNKYFLKLFLNSLTHREKDVVFCTWLSINVSWKLGKLTKVPNDASLKHVSLSKQIIVIIIPSQFGSSKRTRTRPRPIMSEMLLWFLSEDQSSAIYSNKVFVAWKENPSGWLWSDRDFFHIDVIHQWAFSGWKVHMAQLQMPLIGHLVEPSSGSEEKERQRETPGPSTELANKSEPRQLLSLVHTIRAREQRSKGGWVPKRPFGKVCRPAFIRSSRI